jgi:hypothetical protein
MKDLIEFKNFVCQDKEFPELMSFEEAEKYCKNLNLRLPTFKEFYEIAKYKEKFQKLKMTEGSFFAMDDIGWWTLVPTVVSLKNGSRIPEQNQKNRNFVICIREK